MLPLSTVVLVMHIVARADESQTSATSVHTRSRINIFRFRRCVVAGVSGSCVLRLHISVVSLTSLGDRMGHGPQNVNVERGHALSMWETKA